MVTIYSRIQMKLVDKVIHLRESGWKEEGGSFQVGPGRQR
jgi:hypothetical protein